MSDPNKFEVVPPKEAPAKREEITAEDLRRVNSKEGVRSLLKAKNIRTKKILDTLQYEEELRGLQVELVKLQRTVQDAGRRVAIIFEGRDAAGKGGAIRRFTEHLSPRAMRTVALPKPTDAERGQWYFQRYTKHLPDPGEIVFFDRSWYNRAVVEPVNGFCTEEQYQTYMRQVPEFEAMLYEDGLELVKFWFSISKKEQEKRFRSRRRNPLKQWKVSPVDERAQELWDKYTYYRDEMFSRTHTSFSPWIIIRANDKERARLQSIRYVLSSSNYEGKEKAKVSIQADPNIAVRYHRTAHDLD